MVVCTLESDPHCCEHNAWLPCSECDDQKQPSVAANDVEEPMSMIDERQVEVLDNFRSARDVARRHAQSKVDRATLMKIQAEALIAESRELVAELNEETPYPNEEGAKIGPIPGAGGTTR